MNPLEIKPKSSKVLAEVPDLDLWSAQVASVMAFFSLFFESVANDPLGERTQTLQRYMQEAYRRQGIERDPATHDRESSTIRTVISVLKELAENPHPFGYELEVERESIQKTARSLLVDLRLSFGEGGDLENLTWETLVLQIKGDWLLS